MPKFGLRSCNAIIASLKGRVLCCSLLVSRFVNEICYKDVFYIKISLIL